jgi:hypothetical protein
LVPRLSKRLHGSGSAHRLIDGGLHKRSVDVIGQLRP